MLVNANQLGKIYTDQWIIRNVKFEINHKERIGLVGRNGSGKTTLLKLISGNESPDEGQIHIQKDLKIGYLMQNLSSYEQYTVNDVIEHAFYEVMQIGIQMRDLEKQMSNNDLDNKQMQVALREYDRLLHEFESREGYEIESKKLKVCQGLGCSESLLNSNFDTLSGGEKTKIGLAQVLLQKPDLLLLDEPTNHLDLSSIEWLEGFLQQYQGTVLIVSHDRYFLDRITTKIFDMEDGELIVYPGNYSFFIKQKEEELLRQFEQYQEQQKKIKAMKEAIKRLREWANRASPPNAGMHRRASSMEKALHRMEKIKKPILEREKVDLLIQAEKRSGKEVVVLEEISKTMGSELLFRNIKLLIRFQEKVAIIGNNGTGKSTLCQIILVVLKPDKGLVKLGSSIRIGYLSQKGLELINEDQTVIGVFRDEVIVEEGEARHLLAKFLFYGSAVFRKVSNLSGGEKMRLRLAQLMHQQVNLLVLDEPTNHLDMDTREVLEEVLQEYKGTVIAISHDRYFLNQCFEKIYWLEDQSLQLYLGNYDYAKAQREKVKGVPIQASDKKEKKDIQIKKKFSNVRTNVTIESIEEQIIRLEEQLSKIESQMVQLSEQPMEQALSKLQDWQEEKQEIEEQREKLFQELDILI